MGTMFCQLLLTFNKYLSWLILLGTSLLLHIHTKKNNFFIKLLKGSESWSFRKVCYFIFVSLLRVDCMHCTKVSTRR